MAEGLSPCLSGIQKVAGSKLSDKFNTLNHIAKKIVDSENQNAAMQLAVDSSELPEALKPLVQVEVARLSGQFEGICEALKSDDSVVFDRALRAKWFFNGSHENCRVQYYQAQIFPVVSLQNRLKIIKALANNLTANPAIAEEFYTALTLMYGEKQAHPLLMACSESFIWNCVTEHKLRLNDRMVQILFNKYPELVVKYLKLSLNSADESKRNYRPVHSHSLIEFLPRLIKKYPDTFVELLEIPSRPYIIYLRVTQTELFLKSSIDALIRNPKVFMPILCPRIVAKKLTDSQYKNVMAQLFHPELKYFDFDRLFTFDLYDLPKERRLPIITSAFEEVYKVNFLDCTEKISPTAMRILPRDERIKQARVKLQKEPTDEFRYSTRSWVCYLSCEESIPHLKGLVKKTSDCEKRCELLKQLIFTCIVNSDDDELLKVLKYITTRHRNERSNKLSAVFEVLLDEYDLKNLPLEHWEVLYSFTKYLYVKNGKGFSDLNELLKARIVFDLENNHSITDKVTFLVEYNLLHKTGFVWTLLQDNLSNHRKYFDELIRILSSVSDDKKQYLTAEFVHHIMQLIYDLNDRILKAKLPIEKMSIKNYPWILDSIKKFLNDKDETGWEVKFIKKILKEKESEIYDSLVAEDEQEIDLESPKILQILKNNPEKIMKKWELYLAKCMDNIRRLRTQRFIKLCRWYQDLPIKFADKSLNEVTEKKRDGGLIVSGLLFEGSAFAQVAEAFVPTSTTIDADEDDAAAGYQMSSTTPFAFNVVNPPVSLELILKFCVGDYIHTAVKCLNNVSRRTALPKVISFATTLMDRPVSMKKHGIRLFCTVADVKQLRGILMDLWRSETHQTIRALVFKNVFKVFESIPNDETWGMICECIDGLKPDDKDTFESLMKFDSIPNEYIAVYVHKLFSLFRSLGDEENGLQPDVVWSHIEKLLKICHYQKLYSLQAIII
ncbi:uncharacterized protein LOC130675125 [Microplitis mediator]|uniref:uncharacterized protein LOC130675125 n=1 Tax=Microplitis mediator TaxID=375433 RepID=UPI002552323E|nr:uncharacterized protein LOC130675125 [Microplitis mediator]